MLALQNVTAAGARWTRNNNRQFLCYVPFADHNAIIDPSTPDLTGRCWRAWGLRLRRSGIRT